MTTRTTLAALATMFGLTGAANAADYHHIDRYALSLQRQASALVSEFRAHYSHTREYRHLMADAAIVYREAAHVHDVAHHGGNLAHLADDLDRLDRAFHHMEDTLAHLEHDTHFGVGGHVHGRTGHVHRLLASMEDTLHHLRDDVNAALHHDHGFGHGRFDRGHGRVIVPVRPGFGHPRGVHFSSGPRGSSLVIGGNGFGIRIGR